MKEFRKWVRRV